MCVEIGAKKSACEWANEGSHLGHGEGGGLHDKVVDRDLCQDNTVGIRTSLKPHQRTCSCHLGLRRFVQLLAQLHSPSIGHERSTSEHLTIVTYSDQLLHVDIHSDVVVRDRGLGVSQLVGYHLQPGKARIDDVAREQQHNESHLAHLTERQVRVARDGGSCWGRRGCGCFYYGFGCLVRDKVEHIRPGMKNMCAHEWW